jgi:MATE family multidrug resistance protein
MGLSKFYLYCSSGAVINGLVSAIEPLCSNAFGEKKYKLMGLYKNRASIIGCIFGAIMILFHLLTAKYVLQIFNQNEQNLYYGLRYMNICLVSIILDVQNYVNFRFIIVIKKAYVNFILLFTICVLHILWCYIFINVYDLDVLGAGIAINITRFLLLVFGTCYINICNPLPESNIPLNGKCFENIWPFFKYSIGACLLLCARMWAWEVQAIIASYIGEDDFTLHIYLYTIATALYSVTFGIGVTTTIMVGEYITKSNAKNTNRIVWMNLILGILLMTIVLGIFLLFRESILPIFTKNDVLIKKGLPILCIVCLVELFDVAQTTMTSSFRGMGKQNLASILTIINFYIVMIGFSYYLGFTLDLKIMGVWFGMALGCFTTFIVCLIYYLYMNIEEAQKDVKLMIERDHQIISEFAGKDE